MLAMQSCPLLQVVQAFATDAAHVARDTLQINLDFSFESLRDFDELLDRYVPYYTEIAQQMPEFPFPAEMWGSYIGEVLRRKCGGEWIQRSTGTYPELVVKGRRVSPSAAVAQWFESSGGSRVSKFVEEIVAP
jgi:hypothetical protein